MDLFRDSSSLVFVDGIYKPYDEQVGAGSEISHAERCALAEWINFERGM